MNFSDTVKGSLLEGFYPAGWDFEKIDRCCAQPPEEITRRQKEWNKGFSPVECATLADFEVMMGHEIAMQIRAAAERGQQLAMILPVGPMGMYRWAVYFLREWKVSCGHVTPSIWTNGQTRRGIRCLRTTPPPSAIRWNGRCSTRWGN